MSAHADDARARFLDELRSFVGREGSVQTARDPVNQPMIRHWCDAMSDTDPCYTDPDAAAQSRHGRIVAPPAMLDTWLMAGDIPRPLDPADGPRHVHRLLDEAGFTSVVAVDCDHEYDRDLHLGDHLSGIRTVTEVSEEKHTALGVGHFVTTVTEVRDQDGQPVGRMMFRLLQVKPATSRPVEEPSGDAPVASLRPRPGISGDTRFFWDGLGHGELRIQRSTSSGCLFHPPVVRDPGTGGTDFDWVVSSGRGVVYSYTVHHHPPAPGFARHPFVVGLVELDEGTRLVSNVVDVEPDLVHVGMPVEVTFPEVEPGYVLHAFRPRRPPRRETPLTGDELTVGTRLAPCPIPITPTLIVATALASRDYQDVHHDRDAAQRRGAKDIFVNIPTTMGLCARFVTDWAGPEAVLRSLRIRLGAPNHPGDTMTMYGTVTRVDEVGEGDLVEIALRGANSLGDHATGTAELVLPGADRP